MTNTLTMQSENTSLMLEPTNVAEAMNLAGLLAKSSLIPGNFRGKPDDILVAMMWSRNLGLPVLQGMQNIAVINGRPSIWGDAALAVVRRSGCSRFCGPDARCLSDSVHAVRRAGRCL